MKKFWDSSYRDRNDFIEKERATKSAKQYQEVTGGSLFLPRLLAFIALFIIVAIIFITAAAFATNKAHLASGLRKADPKPTEKQQSKYASYTELGQMRLQTADENSVLILEPWFPYLPEDTEFFEEINKKSRAIKIAITSYFRTRTKKELLEEGENKVKKELLTEINNLLVMGSFEAIYFSEYFFLN